MRSNEYTRAEIDAVAETFRLAADNLKAAVVAMERAEMDKVAVHFASLKNTFAGRVFDQSQRVLTDVGTEIRNKKMGAPAKAKTAVETYKRAKAKAVTPRAKKGA